MLGAGFSWPVPRCQQQDEAPAPSPSVISVCFVSVPKGREKRRIEKRGKGREERVEGDGEEVGKRGR